MQQEIPAPLAPASQRSTLVIASVAFLSVLVALAAAVYLSGRVSEDPPPPVPAFQPPVVSSLPRFPVRNVDGSRVLLVADAVPGQSAESTREVDLASASVEVLRPISPADIQPGDRLTVFGVYNPVHNFAVRSVVVQGPGASEGEFPRSAAGFLGFEAARDPVERPILAGTVLSLEPYEATIQRVDSQGRPNPGQVAGRRLRLDRKPVPFTLDLLEGSQAYRLEPAGAAPARPGDRVALREEGGKVGLLILPGSPAQP